MVDFTKIKTGKGEKMSNDNLSNLARKQEELRQKRLNVDDLDAQQLAELVPDGVQYDSEGNLVVASGNAIVPLDAVVEYTGVNLAALEQIAETRLTTVEEQKRAANLPVHVSTERMAEERAVIILAKREQQALLPDTGEVTDGYLVIWRPVNEKAYYSTFIGGMVLVRDLKILQCPVQTRLVKRGRTWQFV